MKRRNADKPGEPQVCRREREMRETGQVLYEQTASKLNIFSEDLVQYILYFNETRKHIYIYKAKEIAFSSFQSCLTLVE